MFTYREKNFADKMQTTWEKVIQHIGIAIFQYNSPELQTRTLMLIPELNHNQSILDIHMHKVQLRNTNHDRLIEARNKVLE